MIPQPCIYIGGVFHKRHIPFEHAFRYRVFTLLLDIDEIPTLSKTLKTFSFNRFNLFSLHERDHGPRDGSPIRPWIEAAAQEKSINIKDGKIMMLTFPRILGYVFNPITLYFCHDKNGALKAILYQVKNTFGGQHGYMLRVAPNETIIKQECAKNFHVSPFIHMDCTYKFRLTQPAETLDFAIHQFTGENEKILTATWDGVRAPLNDKILIKTLLTHPLLTLKIITAIHWQALKLWLKGAKFIPSPPPPEKDIS